MDTLHLPGNIQPPIDSLGYMLERTCECGTWSAKLPRCCNIDGLVLLIHAYVSAYIDVYTTFHCYRSIVKLELRASISCSFFQSFPRELSMTLVLTIYSFTSAYVCLMMMLQWVHYSNSQTIRQLSCCERNHPRSSPP